MQSIIKMFQNLSLLSYKITTIFKNFIIQLSTILNKNLAKIKKLPNKNDLIDSFPFKFILTYG